MLFIDMKMPRITRTMLQGNTATYEIEPLEPSYGMTIGHALQRVLQSSLPGAAITAIRLEGVQHEDRHLPGVREEIIEIILNLKQVRLRCFSEQPVTMRLDASGARAVIAADIETPDTVELINPECHIAQLEDSAAHLTMELIVQAGRGYVPAEVQAVQPLGEIPIDAIYTPIRKVGYTIDRTRVGEMVNFEKITLEVSTDGTMTPDEALRQGSEILLQQFLVLTTPHMVTSEHFKASQGSEVLIPPEIYNKSLEELHLSVRTSNSLKRNASITKVGQILTKNEEDLRKIRNLGDKSLKEIEEGLRMAGCFPAQASDVPTGELGDADALPPLTEPDSIRNQGDELHF